MIYNTKELFFSYIKSRWKIPPAFYEKNEKDESEKCLGDAFFVKKNSKKRNFIIIYNFVEKI